MPEHTSKRIFVDGRTRCRKLMASPACKSCKGAGFLEVPADGLLKEEVIKIWDEDRESEYTIVAGGGRDC